MLGNVHIEQFSTGATRPPSLRAQRHCQNNTACTSFGTMDFGASIFWLSIKIKFLCNLGPGMVFWGCCYCPATCCHMSGRPGVQVIIHGPGTEKVPLFMPSQGARKQCPILEQQEALFPSFSVLLLLFWPWGEGEGAGCMLEEGSNQLQPSRAAVGPPLRDE